MDRQRAGLYSITTDMENVVTHIRKKGQDRPVVDLGARELLENKQDKMEFDETPREHSGNPVTSGGVHAALSDKADKSDTYTKDEINTKLAELPSGGGSGYSVSYSEGVLVFSGDNLPTYNNGILTL